MDRNKMLLQTIARFVRCSKWSDPVPIVALNPSFVSHRFGLYCTVRKLHSRTPCIFHGLVVDMVHRFCRTDDNLKSCQERIFLSLLIISHLSFFPLYRGTFTTSPLSVCKGCRWPLLSLSCLLRSICKSVNGWYSCTYRYAWK